MEGKMNVIESNAALGRNFFARQDELRGGPAPELCAADYRAHLGGNPAMSREHHEGFARGFYAAFPDLRHDVQLVSATADTVAVRFTLHGKNDGPFFGTPATGRPVSVATNVIMRVREGKVVELFGVFDEAGMLRQLGVLPTS
jgi:predicted ester cyclase